MQDAAVKAAQRSLDLSITRYEGGVTSYLEVITAQNQALTDEVTAVNILGRRMASAVLLIQALGGGWDRSELPQRPECCGKIPTEVASKSSGMGDPGISPNDKPLIRREQELGRWTGRRME